MKVQITCLYGQNTCLPTKYPELQPPLESKTARNKRNIWSSHQQWGVELHDLIRMQQHLHANTKYLQSKNTSKTKYRVDVPAYDTRLVFGVKRVVMRSNGRTVQDAMHSSRLRLYQGVKDTDLAAQGTTKALQMLESYQAQALVYLKSLTEATDQSALRTDLMLGGIVINDEERVLLDNLDDTLAIDKYLLGDRYYYGAMDVSSLEVRLSSQQRCPKCNVWVAPDQYSNHIDAQSCYVESQVHQANMAGLSRHLSTALYKCAASGELIDKSIYRFVPVHEADLFVDEKVHALVDIYNTTVGNNENPAMTLSEFINTALDSQGT